jgi:hypothetical protein
MWKSRKAREISKGLWESLRDSRRTGISTAVGNRTNRDAFWLRDTLPAMGVVGSNAEFGLVFVRSRVQLPRLSARERRRHDLIVNNCESVPRSDSVSPSPQCLHDLGGIRWNLEDASGRFDHNNRCGIRALVPKVPRHHQLRKTRLEGSIPVARYSSFQP